MIGQIFRNMPDVVKNLLIINLLFFAGTLLLGANEWIFRLGMHYPSSDSFKPYQIVTHMFMHGGFAHLFFNMFALVMFGSALERVWGPKKMLLFYFVTGLGAVALHIGVQAFEVHSIVGNLTANNLDIKLSGMHYEFDSHLLDTYSREEIKRIGDILYTPTVGASGAIFGLLLAFAMYFPNTELMLLFFPVPVKAKYFIPIMMVLELFLGVRNFEMDNVAHFAHLGGALFGFIMVKIWQRDRTNFY